MWKYRAIYIAALLSAGAVYIATNERHLFMFLIVLAVLPVISFAMLFLSTGKIQIGCELQEACIVYQRIGMNIKMIYQGVFPIGRIRLTAQYHNLMFQKEEEQTIFLENGNAKELSYEMPYVSRDCGRIEMQFSKVAAYDIMGLFSRKIPLIQTYDFTIYPEVINMGVRLGNLPTAKNLGDHYDQNRKGQDVTEVFGIRDYQDGDSPRSIHWKLSSKWDQLVVREFSHPSNYDTLVLYDPTFPEKKVKYHEVVNSVLGVTASISKSLMSQNLAHHVGGVSRAKFTDSRVEDKPTYMQALANMMSTVLPDVNENVLDEFLKRDVGKAFTKIVLVTSNFDEYNVRRLADLVDLTVVLISADGEDRVEKEMAYDVITRTVESLKTKTWILEI
ncbi:MAG: DUF58 domain-containing protein [Hespellia sp.]|nr:DUF58 domain-containing protein [Hespellia sp.]